MKKRVLEFVNDLITREQPLEFQKSWGQRSFPPLHAKEVQRRTRGWTTTPASPMISIDRKLLFGVRHAIDATRMIAWRGVGYVRTAIRRLFGFNGRQLAFDLF
jgi:hypothetical protein